MIDGVPQLVMIFAVVGGDCLPCIVSYCILVSGSKSWTHVMAEHIWSAKDLHDCLVLFSSRARNSLDSKLWQSGDVNSVQQILQSTNGDRGFVSEGLDLVGVMIRFFLFDITQRIVVFIIFAFSLVAFFFFLVVLFFFLMIIVVVLR
jgi:hypothetical protein